MKADIQIRLVTESKWDHLPLLLLGDEQKSLIDGYLDRGDLFVLEREGEECGACVVTREAPGCYELQNIAVTPRYRQRGFGRALVEFIWSYYPDLRILQLGTGDSPSTVGFYQALGFEETGRERDYFLKYYDHPIYEDGKQLRDRVRYQKAKAL